MKLQAIITDDILAEIDRRAEAANNGGLNRSAVVQEHLDRYFHLLKLGKRQLHGRFTSAELSLIVDSSNGTLHQAWSIPHLDRGIADSIELDQLDEKWGVDGLELLKKLNNLTTAQQFALVDAVEGFWRAVSLTPDGHAQPKPGDVLRF